MGFADPQKNGKGYRARYKNLPGLTPAWPLIKDAHGRAVIYPTKRDAKRAATDREYELAHPPAVAPVGQDDDGPDYGITVTEWATRWLAAQDVKRNTITNYRWAIEHMILPAFGDRVLRRGDDPGITYEEVVTWERDLRIENGGPYEPGTAERGRARLVTMLADAVEAKIIDRNPAAARRNRGRKGKSRAEQRTQEERAWGTPLEILLVAERAALLSGRPHDFVLVVHMAYACLRKGEALATEPGKIKPPNPRKDRPFHYMEVDQQLQQYPRLGYVIEPPKDESDRDADMPAFLRALLGELADIPDRPRCSCHPDRDFLFLNANGTHISTSTYQRRFTAAAEGRWPAKDGSGVRRPVYADADGLPLKLQGNASRARELRESAPLCWSPIVVDLEPHGCRHSGNTWAEDAEIHTALCHERMGHTPSKRDVHAAYTHITKRMRAKLLDALTEMWRESLRERAERFGPHSAVPMLDALLAPYRGEEPGDDSMIIPSASHQQEVTPLPTRPRKVA